MPSSRDSSWPREQWPLAKAPRGRKFRMSLEVHTLGQFVMFWLPHVVSLI